MTDLMGPEKLSLHLERSANMPLTIIFGILLNEEGFNINQDRLLRRLLPQKDRWQSFFSTVHGHVGDERFSLAFDRYFRSYSLSERRLPAVDWELIDDG